MKWFGLIFIFLTLNVSAFETFSRFSDDKVEKFFVSYESKGGWVLDEFELRPGQLQKKINTYTFASLHELRDYERSATKGLSRNKGKFKSLVTTEKENRVIWQPENEWNLEWEKKFGEWVAQTLTFDFFVKHQISTDCADVAFALRWIFSRIHKLPAAQTLAVTEVVFSHESFKDEWKDLPTAENWYEDRLFMTALGYLLENVYTKTLYMDTFPIKVSRDTMFVGTIDLLGGHTLIISRIDYDSQYAVPMQTMNSTIPADIRELDEMGFFPSYNVDPEEGGLLRMRWPVKTGNKWKLVPKKDMLHYSTEQYDEDFHQENEGFGEAVFRHLGVTYDPEGVVKNIFAAAKTMLSTRKEIVRQGFAYCAQKECVEGSMDYEDWSTPTRDGRVAETIQKAIDFVKKAVDDSEGDYSDRVAALKITLKNYLAKKVKIENVERTYAQWLKFFKFQMVSSHPKDTIKERWGATDLDIQNFVGKNYQRYLNLRSKTVVASNPCPTSGGDCSVGSNQWKEFQTYDLDQKWKNSVLNYLKFCQGTIQCDDKTLLKKMVSTFAMVSNPSAPQDQRMGTQVNVSKLKVIPYKTSIEDFGSNMLYVDEQYLYQLSKPFQPIKIPHAISNEKLIIGLDVDKKKLVYLDRITNVWKKFAISMDSYEEVIGIHWVGGDYYIASIGEDDDEYGHQLLKYSQNKFKKIQDLSNVSFSEGLGLHTFTADDDNYESTLFYEHNGELLKKKIPGNNSRPQMMWENSEFAFFFIGDYTDANTDSEVFTVVRFDKTNNLFKRLISLPESQEGKEYEFEASMQSLGSIVVNQTNSDWDDDCDGDEEDCDDDDCEGCVTNTTHTEEPEKYRLFVLKENKYKEVLSSLQNITSTQVGNKFLFNEGFGTDSVSYLYDGNQMTNLSQTYHGSFYPVSHYLNRFVYEGSALESEIIDANDMKGYLPASHNQMRLYVNSSWEKFDQRLVLQGAKLPGDAQDAPMYLDELLYDSSFENPKYIGSGKGFVGVVNLKLAKGSYFLTPGAFVYLGE